ncbi:MAG: hypothetical protein K2O45_09765 [Oscillospiraceae bacterium]|nr:hypothetical protein [Oscillospiraceae bacterium]
MYVSAGLLLLSAAILLGEAGWIPHGAQLFLMGLACALEMRGAFGKGRKNGEGKT